MTDIRAHIAAAYEKVVACPVSVSTIRVTGKDRASFLHNFCTQQIKELPAGQCAEATFTNVKARVIDHGYVLAGHDCHMVVTFGKSAEQLHQHLDRYIITEDVQLELQSGWSATAVIGPQAFETVGAIVGCSIESGQCDSDRLTWLSSNWDGIPIVWRLEVSTEQSISNDRCPEAPGEVFEYLRIREGFPVVGIDVNGDNIAPEANRIRQSISYTKGCYLGQEPIARLDAMGSVNRQLYQGQQVGPSDQPGQATITSMAEVNGEESPVLVMAKVKDVATGQVIATAPDGSVVEVRISTK